MQSNPKPKRFARRKFLKSGAILGLLAGGACWEMRSAAARFQVTTKPVPLPYWTAPSRVRLLHLSDFHAPNDLPYKHVARAVELSLATQPDLICLTGDFISWTLEEAATYTALLRRLTQRAPTFACLGNHDGGRWAARHGGYSDTHQVRALLAESGVHLLHNAAEQILVKGQKLTLAGLGNDWAEECQPETVLSLARPEQLPTLVLSHNPDSKALLAKYDWDLMLCGHAHGGQLIVPLIGWTPFAPIRDKRYAHGLNAWEKRWIHTTRGVGNLHGLRCNCPPEISLLELQPAG